ncbi:Bifunctional DNA primase/polymerase, N-terminal [Rhizobiales bacterium GAS113]|nr:Bifunctional DNA primase/polymerase, N-terminal [Rhizobiales bacterium GAS113]
MSIHTANSNSSAGAHHDETSTRQQHNLALALCLARAGIAIFATIDKVPLVVGWNRLDVNLTEDDRSRIVDRKRSEFEKRVRAGKANGAFYAPTEFGCTRDPARVRRLWAKWPDAVPSIALGPSGLFVLDGDNKSIWRCDLKQPLLGGEKTVTVEEKNAARVAKLPGKREATVLADGDAWSFKVDGVTYTMDADARTALRGNGAEHLGWLIENNAEALRDCAITRTQSGGLHVIMMNGVGEDRLLPRGFKDHCLDVLADGDQIVASGAWRRDSRRYIATPDFADLATAYESLGLSGVPQFLIEAGGLVTAATAKKTPGNRAPIAPSCEIDAPHITDRLRRYVKGCGELDGDRHSRAASIVRIAGDFGMSGQEAVAEVLRMNDEGELYEVPIDDEDFENYLWRMFGSREGAIGCDYNAPWVQDDGTDFGAVEGEDGDIMTPDQRGEVGRLIKTKRLAYSTAVARVFPERRLAQQVSAMNMGHAVVSLGGKTRIIREARKNGLVTGFDLIDVTAHHQFHANAIVFAAEGNKQKKVKVSIAWFESPSRRTYDRMTFDPRGRQSGKNYNTWRGFKVKPDSSAGSCEKFLAYVHQDIANGEKEIEKWVLGYAAHMVQRPWEKPRTALVLRGLEGTGKSTLGYVLGSLLWSDNVFVADHENQLTQNFNAHLADKLLFIGEEVLWAADKKGEGVLKALVTERTMTIERKGIDTETHPNYMRFIFSTNKNWAVPAGVTARRYTVVDVGDAHRGDTDYWRALHVELDNGGREALMAYLMAWDLSAVDVTKIILTNALLDQKLANLDAVTSWVLDQAQNGDLWIDDNGKMSRAAVFNGIRTLATVRSLRSHDSDRAMGKKLRELIPELGDERTGADGGRERRYVFPQQAEVRKNIEAHLGQPIEWEHTA